MHTSSDFFTQPIKPKKPGHDPGEEVIDPDLWVAQLLNGDDVALTGRITTIRTLKGHIDLEPLP